MIQATVALLSPPFSLLTYSLPEYLPQDSWQARQRVAVPLGKGLRAGVLLETADLEESGDFILKPLFWPLEREPVLPPGYMELARQLALRQGASPGRILGSLLPAGLRSAKARFRFFGPGKPEEYALQAMAKLPRETLKRLGGLWAVGMAEAILGGQSPLDAEVCVLLQEPPWSVRPAARAQLALLEYLFERGVVTRRGLYRDLGARAAATLTLLAQRGLVGIRPADDPSLGPPVAEARTRERSGSGETGLARDAEDHGLDLVSPGTAFTLTPHQRAAYEPLRAAALGAAASGKAETRLLFGITGSGKTAVFLELAREVLAAGRSVMLLAPEVALALKLRNDAELALPDARQFLFHGYQAAGRREALFRYLAREKGPFLVVGTRSALFLPLDNLGLIVLDEEHDASFKQDEGLMYQAKEVAWYRAGQEGALLLLSSATPDVKSFYAALAGTVPIHTLNERVGGGTLPEVRLVALPKGRQAEGLLAPESMEALVRAVERGEQAVILLNRRGYAPVMYCLTCSAVAKCPHCDIGLAYHKGRERLVCHYCGYAAPFPSPCASCKGMHFLPMGLGTEKLEEGLAAALPAGTPVLRLDRDSTRKPGRMEEILRAFARKEAQVLVGTQMLSKGHHFPDVTLAVAADADVGLNLPDYRAAERTFQLLLQSAGRSGRGEKPGTVIIQTRDPSHYCWEFVKNADYQGFYARELALREKRGYPPFVRLALIGISHEVRQERAQEEVAALGRLLRERGRELGLTVLGPAPAALPFLRGMRRYHCLIKAREWTAVRALFAEAQAALRKGRLRIRLDIDPVNML